MAYIVRSTSGTFYGYKFYKPFQGDIKLTYEATNSNIEELANALGADRAYKCKPANLLPVSGTGYVPQPNGDKAIAQKIQPLGRVGGMYGLQISDSTTARLVELMRLVGNTKPAGEVVWAGG